MNNLSIEGGKIYLNGQLIRYVTNFNLDVSAGDASGTLTLTVLVDNPSFQYKTVGDKGPEIIVPLKQMTDEQMEVFRGIVRKELAATKEEDQRHVREAARPAPPINLSSDLILKATGRDCSKH
ncbi:hypothetical protein PA598K_01489 [Paenibacillus sp. 598K]|uniref:hypothetical protein n=1 Tax=Paenibacillus sp. 598K TaxID=1117987 RepID=UPI000FF9C6D5|nr:hypothetical protein [Paenibacillus sp. 598K]GBF73204.1 hypothetical protein PA598K_01489 [Paenibacillus sp. 598K]